MGNYDTKLDQAITLAKEVVRLQEQGRNPEAAQGLRTIDELVGTRHRDLGWCLPMVVLDILEPGTRYCVVNPDGDRYAFVRSVWCDEDIAQARADEMRSEIAATYPRAQVSTMVLVVQLPSPVKVGARARYA